MPKDKDRIAYPYVLPSLGRAYSGKIPGGEVEIWPLNVKQQRAISAMRSSAPYNHILDACLKTEFPVSQLLVSDQLALILNIRILSWGDTRTLKIVCGSCRNAFSHKVNLRELEEIHLPDNFVEPIEIRLPMSGARLEVRLMRVSDLEALERAEKDVERVHRQAARNDSPMPSVSMETYPQRLAQQILSVDGKTLDWPSLIDWIDELLPGDAAAIDRELEKNDSGVVMDLEIECPRSDCRHRNEVSLVSNAYSFFYRD